MNGKARQEDAVLYPAQQEFGFRCGAGKAADVVTMT